MSVDEEAARSLLGLAKSGFGWMNEVDEPVVPAGSSEADTGGQFLDGSPQSDSSTILVPPPFRTTSTAAPFPWAKPAIRKRKGFRRNPNSNNLPHLKAKLEAAALSRAQSELSTRSDASDDAGPSSQKRIKLASPAANKPRVKKETAENDGVWEDDVNTIKTRGGVVVRRNDSAKRPTSASRPEPTALEVSGWNKRLIEVEQHRRVRADFMKNFRPEQVPAGKSTPSSDKASIGQTVELQTRICLNLRYKHAPQCKQCIARITGDLCRFRFFRFFPVDPKTGRIAGSPFFESSDKPHPCYTWPLEFNVDPLGEGSFQRMEVRRAVAQALVPVLITEYNHASTPGFVRRATSEGDLEQRSKCDHCNMTIFSGCVICQACGREYCLECLKIFPLESEPAQSVNYARLTKCIKRTEHRPSNFLRVGLWTAETIHSLLLEIVEFCIEQNAIKLPLLTSSLDGRLRTHLIGLQSDEARATELRERHARALEAEDFYHAIKKKGWYEVCWNRGSETQSDDPGDPSGVKSLPFFIFKDTDLDEKSCTDVFNEFWSRRHFIVLHGAADALKLDWSAQQFVESFGETIVDVIDSETEQKEAMDLASFFGMFGDYEGRTQRWKVKDWPPKESFSTAAPELYTDLMQALPMPSSTRLDGVRNLAAYGALDSPSPDLGPKLYAAFTGVEETGSGTTRCHMDMTDAINIMVHAEDTEQGHEGCAAWDIFPPEASPLIKEFLRETQFLTDLVDPIHCQKFYLNAKMRKALFEKKQVASTRIYQYKGDAVFIPAGCAHQVCNLADCIKVALDFASPENIATCKQLTSEFRAMSLSPKIAPWKEDVLALNNMLLSTWVHSGELKRQGSLVPPFPSQSPASSSDAASSADLQPEAGSSGSAAAPLVGGISTFSSKSTPSSRSRDPQLILDMVEDWANLARKADSAV